MSTENLKITGYDYHPVKHALSWITWPGLFTLCTAIAAYGFAHDTPILFFNLAYLLLIVALFFIERFMPHEKEWQQPDGQTFANIAHTLTSKGTVQALLLFSGVIGLAELIKPVAESGYGLFGWEIWPRQWPMALQAVLGLVVAEFGLYWAHRLAHERPVFWRFHAIHHSVTKLWFVNTGRFHFIDSLLSIVLGMSVLLALGAPLEVVKWQAVITAFIGMLTHCNVEMRFGPISWIFNTPGLHRWHHSKDLREGNKNYGENVMIWDQIFGTYFNENRRPPVNIGIDSYMPPQFTQQLLWPFLSEHQKKNIINKNDESHTLK